MQRARRAYLIVGMVLFIATVTTVAVASVTWLDVGGHGSDAWDAALGLSIAIFKSSLVALVFMHLNHERKAIYYIILLASLHAAGFFLGALLHFGDFVNDWHFYGDPAKEGEGPYQAFGNMATCCR